MKGVYKTMIQLPVHFKDVKSAEQFVSILEEFPYACDLTSGTQSGHWGM